MAETPKLLNRMMKLPLRVFVVSLEMFVETAQELRRLIDESIDAMLSAPDASATAGGSTFTPATDETRTETRNESSIADCKDFALNDSAGDSAVTTLKERVNMRDANLNDDMLKLVRFKILFVKRDYETAFQEEEDLVWDNMTGADFSAWKVAEFIQKLAITPRQVRYPRRWLDKTKYHQYALTENGEKIEPPPKPLKDKAENKPEPILPLKKPYWLIDFPEDDKKYLRVYYEVLERYPREKLRYEERQLEILEKIADGVAK